MMELSDEFRHEVKEILTKYHNKDFTRFSKEKEFVEYTCQELDGLSVKNSDERLDIKTGDIDKSPIADFKVPKNGKKKKPKEIADLLFVTKHIKDRELETYKAAFSQTKFTKENKLKWKKVDLYQYYLLTRWPKFKIEHKTKGVSGTFDIDPKNKTFSTYSFVGKPVPIPFYYTASLVGSHLSSSDFRSHESSTFRLKDWPHPRSHSPLFLMNLIYGIYGESLIGNGDILSLVDALYQIVGLKKDPPDDWKEKNNLEQKEGTLGIVEFTLRKGEEVSTSES